jgi:hypothetical protein
MPATSCPGGWNRLRLTPVQSTTSRELAVSAALTGLLVARGSIPQVAALLDEQLATGANQVLVPIANDSTTIPCPRTR